MSVYKDKNYHELFDEAVERYNAKQTRSDRCIKDYYEKIRTGKQEKLFYEVIFQVGNKDDMAANAADGKTAANILNDFMKDFQERNPHMRVFSAHLHMDEATPHLHIDFVPFITCSKRGLETRVSLKQALAAQGFAGGTRGDTEWSQWVKSEKEQLAQAMQKHGVEWEQRGTHDEHLSVMDFKKEQRAQEAAALDGVIAEKQSIVERLDQESTVKQGELDKVEGKLAKAMTKVKIIGKNARRFDEDPEFQLLEPKPLMSAKAYHDRIVMPLVSRLKDAIRSILSQFYDKAQALDRANRQVEGLTDRLAKVTPELARLQAVEKDYGRLRRGIGDDKANDIIKVAQALEHVEKSRVSRKAHDHLG